MCLRRRHDGKRMIALKAMGGAGVLLIAACAGQCPPSEEETPPGTDREQRGSVHIEPGAGQQYDVPVEVH